MSIFAATLLLALAPQKAGTSKPLKPQEALEVFRPYVQRQVPKTTQFNVNWYKTKGDWAFIHGTPYMRNGKPSFYVNYRETGTSIGIDCVGLLHRESGKWTIKQAFSQMGPYFGYARWVKGLGVPKEIVYPDPKF